MNTTDEAFYRRFTLPEELKNRSRTATEWCGVHRWFASPNVIKLEDHREPGEMGRILERLRQRKRAASTVAVPISWRRRESDVRNEGVGPCWSRRDRAPVDGDA